MKHISTKTKGIDLSSLLLWPMFLLVGNLLKMPFLLLAFLFTLTGLATMRGKKNNKNHHITLCFRRVNRIIFKCINKGA